MPVLAPLLSRLEILAPRSLDCEELTLALQNVNLTQDLSPDVWEMWGLSSWEGDHPPRICGSREKPAIISKL